jgi:hypothetical protein
VAKVTPVFKTEDPTDFSNYRSISVLPVLSQVFEKVLRARLLEFLDLQGVINSGQDGFRAGHFTAMAIQDMVGRMRGSLILKKASLGVLRLLGSYMEGRFQYVVYNGSESGRWVIRCGVP